MLYDGLYGHKKDSAELLLLISEWREWHKVIYSLGLTQMCICAFLRI